MLPHEIRILDRDYCHQFWRDPPDANSPKTYIDGHEQSSEFLVRCVKAAKIPKSGRILELGCNVGTNLAYLADAGYTNLAGIEINPQAVSLLRETYPQLSAAKIYTRPIEDGRFGRNRMVYTMAVLEHLHPDSEPIFERIAKSTRLLLTIEDEVGYSTHHCPRYYDDVFCGLGMEMVWAEQPSGHSSDFVARMFRWPK